MPLSLALVLHILLAIEIIFIESYKRKRGLVFFDFLTMANIFFLLSYSLTPIFYLCFSDTSILLDTEYVFQIATISFFAYQMLLLGWIATGSLRFRVKKPLPTSLLENKWYRLSIIFLIIAFLMMILLILDKGGVSGYLSGALARYSFEDADAGSFAFLSRLISIIPFLTTIFFYFLIKKPVGLSKKAITVLFAISLSLSVLQAFGSASRGGLIRLFLLLGLVYVLVYRSIKLLPTMLISILAILFITYGKQTFYAVSNYAAYGESFSDSFDYLDKIRSNASGEDDNVFFREFAHPYRSMDTALRYKNSGYIYTYFSDFIWSPFRIIPSRYTSIFFERPEPIHNLNTQLTTGVPDSGGMPPGLIASFYYSLGVLGVALGSFFYGLIGRRVNIWLQRMMQTSKIYSVLFAFFAYYYGFFIANGDPNIYIYYLITPSLFLLGLKFIKPNKQLL